MLAVWKGGTCSCKTTRITAREKKIKTGLCHVWDFFGWLELSLHICCVTQKPYWILSITYHPWHVLGSQQTTYNSVAEGILMMRLCHRLPALLTKSDGLCLRCVLESEWCECVRMCVCKRCFGGRHVFATWLTMTPYKWSHKSPTPPITHSHTYWVSSLFLQPWHALQAGTDYSPVCLFWLWLLIHPDRFSSGLLCAQYLMG